jgi:hypothetical protein
MAGKYRMKCSTSLVTKEMQIKTVLTFHLTPVRMAIIKGNNNNKCWQVCGDTGALTLCWKECKLLQPLWKAEWRVLKKLEIELPYSPVIPLLGIFPKEPKTEYNRDSCTLLFITAPFTIAKLWKQPRFPITDEWIKTLWYTYTMEYYSATRNNDIGFDGKWMQLVDIMLSELARIRNTKDGCVLSYVEDRSQD